MSTPAASLPGARLPPLLAPGRRGELARAAAPAVAAALLGAAIATGIPAVVGLALVPFLLAALTRPDGAILVFAVALYLNLPVILSTAAGVPTALGSAFALILLVPVAAYLIGGRRPLVTTPALALMIGYLAALVLSAALAAGPSTNSAAVVGLFLLEGALLYVLVSNSVRSVQTLRRVVWALVLAGALMGATSLWQELTHSYNQTLGGFAQTGEEGFPPASALAGEEVRPRLAGPIGEKNRYAQILLVLLPLALFCVKSERSRALRFAAAGSAALIMSGVMLTFSRGAGVALVVLVLAMLAMGFIALRHVIALLLALVALVVVAVPDYAARLATLNQAEESLSGQRSAGTDTAIQGRATENLAALRTWADHPLLGVGPGEFFERYSRTVANELGLRYLKENRRAHNLYLEIAADTGVLGLGAFLAMVGTTLVQLWRLGIAWAGRRPELASLAQGFALALVAYLATGMFLQLAFQRYFWFVLALANAAIWILRHEQAPDERA